MPNESFTQNGLTKMTVEVTSEVGLLKKMAVKGAFFLGLRRILLQVILTGTNIILARLLFPEVFGTFAIAMGIVNFLSLFASLGLEVALIQKKTDPIKEELQTIFTVSLLLTFLITVIIIILAPLFFHFYEGQLGERGVFYLQILAISLVGFSLRGISVSLLERRLDYPRLVVAETLDILILQLVAIVLAISGFGVLSFILGTLASRFLGSAIFFVLAPWPVGLRFSFKKIKEMLSFGLNYQFNLILGGLNGAVIPLFVGRVAGSAGVGYLNWAGGLATFPRMVPDILGRLIFPVGARAQTNQLFLRQIIEKTIQLSCLTCFPLIIILAALVKPVTYLIYTDKWLPGIPALYFFSLQSIFIIIGGILTQTLLALGEAKIVRNISLFWMIAQWVLTVPLVFKFGFTGLAMAGAIVSSTFFIPLAILRKRVSFAVGSHVWPYLIYSLMAGIVTFVLNQRWPAQKIEVLILWAFFGGISYLSLIFLFKRKGIIEDVQKIKEIFLKK